MHRQRPIVQLQHPIVQLKRPIVRRPTCCTTTTPYCAVTTYLKMDLCAAIFPLYSATIYRFAATNISPWCTVNLPLLWNDQVFVCAVFQGPIKNDSHVNR